MSSHPERVDQPAVSITATDLNLLVREKVMSSLQGWLLTDSADAMIRLLSDQSEKGDILEIGPYRGQSTAILKYCLWPGETLWLNDLFQAPDDAGRGYYPEHERASVTLYFKDNPPFTEEKLLEVLAPFGTEAEVKCIKGPSIDLPSLIPQHQKFRFSHIDGGHDFDCTLRDIIFCAAHSTQEGIIAVDDWKNISWPEVGLAMDHFLKNFSEWRIIEADGGKAYLRRKL